MQDDNKEWDNGPEAEEDKDWESEEDTVRVRKSVGTSTKKWDAEDSKPHYATWGADRALRLRQREQRSGVDQATVAQVTDLAVNNRNQHIRQWT